MATSSRFPAVLALPAQAARKRLPRLRISSSGTRSMRSMPRIPPVGSPACKGCGPSWATMASTLPHLSARPGPNSYSSVRHGARRRLFAAVRCRSAGRRARPRRTGHRGKQMDHDSCDSVGAPLAGVPGAVRSGPRDRVNRNAEETRSRGVVKAVRVLSARTSDSRRSPFRRYRIGSGRMRDGRLRPCTMSMSNTIRLLPSFRMRQWPSIGPARPCA